MPFFSRIVITAANERQAAGYRAVLSGMEICRDTETIVVPDPGGRRAGSLLATVNALSRSGIRSGRTLVCHSGGDSKRLPSYAAIGKAFVPVPRPEGGRWTLFEKIVSDMSRLRLPGNGVLVVCGDVAPQFDFASCSFASSGVTGVAFRGDFSRASRHGVYVLSGRKVKGFLQKPDRRTAEKAGAAQRGWLAVDTGIMWLAPDAVRRMMKEYSPYLKLRPRVQMDIYERFTSDLVSSGRRFEANLVDECDFFHIGTTKELLSRLGGGQRWVDACGIPESEMKLQGRNVVTFVPRSYGKVELARGECLTAFPLKDGGWKYLRYRVEDDFKTDGLWQKHGMDALMLKADRKAMLGLGREVSVSLPLRIDFAGGWSDTPPICNELGGRVLNAAVMLSSRNPVNVRVARIPGKSVHVKSLDLRRSTVITAREAIYSPKDPRDWCALVKSALAVSGYEFSEGGLEISVFADVPKGSGMGTSSLLGAALLTALARIRGRDDSSAAIGDLTLALEREMGTGGGWQDQYGGLLPGVKLLSTAPGGVQRPKVRMLGKTAERKFSEWLRERALLYFTGQKRMARNILRGVLSYYRSNPGGLAHDTVKELKATASEAFDALEKQDFDGFADCLNRYWRAKKALDPGSTNESVESLMARVAPYSSAAFLCGAGGGGFMFIAAKDAGNRRKLARMLKRDVLFKSGQLYAFSLVSSYRQDGPADDIL